MKQLSKKKQYLIDYIHKIDNRSLLDEALDSAQGDDYDGCFTPLGLFKYEQLVKELYLRLKDWFGDEV